jgi:hypothetical protein
MLFWYLLYWGGCHLFKWAIPERYHMRCEENLPIFQAPIAIKQRTAKTYAGGGTLTAGLWVGVQLGETSSDGKIN